MTQETQTEDNATSQKDESVMAGTFGVLSALLKARYTEGEYRGRESATEWLHLWNEHTRKHKLKEDIVREACWYMMTYGGEDRKKGCCIINEAHDIIHVCIERITNLVGFMLSLRDGLTQAGMTRIPAEIDQALVEFSAPIKPKEDTNAREAKV